MRCLLFSICVLLAGCASEYKTLKQVPLDQACLSKIQPAKIQTQWFDASIDVVGKHISGLLLVKTLDDNTRRVVFTNEAGVTFLHFGWDAENKFKVHQIISQLGKKVVIDLL